MYAIVKTGGKQYRVERGQRLVVERLPVAEGESVSLEPVLFRSDDAVFDKATLEKVKVTAKVIGHERGDKLRVFKFKPKRGYKRRTGHRQELTRIEVTELGLGGGARPKAKQAGASDEAAAPKAAASKGASAKASSGKADAAKAGAPTAGAAAAKAAKADGEGAAAAPKSKAGGAADSKPRTGAKSETAKEAKRDGA